MIKALIFDFDGVIHDTFDLAYNTNKEVIPGLSKDDYRDLFNGNIYKNKKITEESARLFFKAQNKKFKKLVIKEEIKNDILELKDIYQLFIVSSNMEVTLNDYLLRNNLEFAFKEVLGFESGESKIKKFKIITDRYNLILDDCFFITDTLGDIMEAN